MYLSVNNKLLKPCLLPNHKKCVQLRLSYISYRNTKKYLTESNMVSTKMMFEIPANQKVHTTLEFDSKHKPVKLSITSYIRILN